MIRRDFYRYGTMLLGGLMTAALAVPGVAYLLEPLRKLRGEAKTYKLAKLSELAVGVPRSFPIIDERQDAWVKYPKESVGLVWLVRQPDDSEERVIAFQAECPHLGCAINLNGDKTAFRCPCHDSAFSFKGTAMNRIPPRSMDRLTIVPLEGADPIIQVKFERFRSQSEEKIPLFNRLANWLDSRTGYKRLVHEALEEPIPGGARWRYVFGSALTITFFIQLVTGLLLMTSYSPSSSTAWGSVWYITYKMGFGGWFIRGLHHFGSQAMVILLVLHLIQVVLAGAYRAPREVNWWFGLALMGVTLGFSLTGYLLPWDQKGYWATKVATKIASGAPGIGPSIEKVVVGGDDYGNQTLTRFYGLHVGVLPALLVTFLVAHVALFRKHGVTAPAKATGSEPFWPKQVFYDTLAGVVVLGILAAVVWKQGGAPLDAPADPGSLDYPARPEWYFLSLFQMLKKFPGKYEFLGTQVVPGALAVVLLLLPLLDKVFPRKFAHFVACMFVFAVVGGAGYLTVEALRADSGDPAYRKSREAADVETNRALLLADNVEAGIPINGAGDLLARDPLTRGMALLKQKCLGCHAFDGKTQREKDSPYQGFDLAHFATREWLGEFLDNPGAAKFVVRVPTAPGATTSKPLTGMQTWKKTYDFDDKRERDRVVAFVASFANIPADQSVEDWAAQPRVKDHPGFAAFVEKCLPCHAVGNLGPADKELRAPGLYAYGSPDWLARMIKNPGARGLYGFKKAHEQMPGFAEELTQNDLEMLVRLMRDRYVGAPERREGPGRIFTAQ